MMKCKHLKLNLKKIVKKVTVEKVQEMKKDLTNLSRDKFGNFLREFSIRIKKQEVVRREKRIPLLNSRKCKPNPNAALHWCIEEISFLLLKMDRNLPFRLSLHPIEILMVIKKYMKVVH